MFVRAKRRILHGLGCISLQRVFTADRRGRETRRSVIAFNEPIAATIAPYQAGLLGKTVTLPEESDKVVLPLLVRAAELLFKPTRGETIELYPIFEYFWTPTDKRENAAWQPTDL